MGAGICGSADLAVERIRKLSLAEERFEIAAELSSEAYGHSLGVNRDTPEQIVVIFKPRIAGYVRERLWHTSQKLAELPDGSVRMTLTVCADAALKTWILGFGSFARVESPSWVAEEILEQLDEARDAYVPRLDFALPQKLFAPDAPELPGLRPPWPSWRLRRCRFSTKGSGLIHVSAYLRGHLRPD